MKNLWQVSRYDRGNISMTTHLHDDDASYVLRHRSAIELIPNGMKIII